MESDMIIGLRTTVVFAALFTTLAVHSDLLRTASAPLIRIRNWYLRFRESLRTDGAGKGSKRFWEIDMTEFEP